MKKKKEKSVNDEVKPNLKTICIIPARGGSKGYPDKNIKPLLGHPVIWYTIIAAQKAKQIDRIIVSTDSPQYRDIIDGQCGKGMVPFLRPAELASDSSAVKDAILYTIDRMERDWQEKFDIVLLLEPTSPLRTHGQINEVIGLLKDQTRYRAVVSVVDDRCRHPLDAFEMGQNDELRPYGGGHYPPGHRSRQALRPVYFMDGSIYASYIDTYRERGSFTHELTLGYPVPGWQSDEIDYDYDLVKIEAIMKWRKT